MSKKFKFDVCFVVSQDLRLNSIEVDIMLHCQNFTNLLQKIIKLSIPY